MTNDKQQTELAVLRQLEKLHAWQQFRDDGNTQIQVHQVGFAPYRVYLGAGNYDGVGEPLDYSAVQPDAYGFPMLPSDFEKLVPVLEGLGIGAMVWGGDIENIPPEKLLSIPDFRIAMQQEAQLPDNQN